MMFERHLCADSHYWAIAHVYSLGGLIMLFRPRQEEGQGLVEYALILVLVAVVVIVILAVLGPTIGNIFSNIGTGLKMNGAG
jgi:pilus assembly protein Flp/PilA